MCESRQPSYPTCYPTDKAVGTSDGGGRGNAEQCKITVRLGLSHKISPSAKPQKRHPACKMYRTLFVYSASCLRLARDTALSQAHVTPHSHGAVCVCRACSMGGAGGTNITYNANLKQILLTHGARVAFQQSNASHEQKTTKSC